MDDGYEAADRRRGRAKAAPKSRRQETNAKRRSRAQTAGRVRAFRSRERKKKVAEKSERTLVAELLESEIKDTRHRYYTSLENVQWIARVGSTPSAAGARAPLAAIISNVTFKPMSRWTVELYRWRIYAYGKIREQEIAAELIRKGAFGLKVNFDETPCRLYLPHEGRAGSVSAQIRCVSVFGGDEGVLDFAPRLSRPCDGSGISLYRALNIESTPLADLCLNPSSWKFLLVGADSAAANDVALRHVVKHCERYPRLLVIYNRCFAHILSNATKWGLGKKFPFGNYLRVSHVLQARPIKDARALCASRLQPYSAHQLPAMQLGAEVWHFDIERFFSTNGPFTERKDSVGFAARAALCATLWPRGLPATDDPWPVAPDCAVADYARAVLMLFRRTIQTPIASRWYSVESFSWFLILARRFRLFDFVLRAGEPLRYWPGDNPVAADADPGAYAARSRIRMSRTLEFLQSTEFVVESVACAISSLPRWRFARCLFPDDAHPRGDVGVAAACVAFVAEANVIFAGAHQMAEHLVDTEPIPVRSYIRLRTYVVIASSAVYLAEKNLPCRNAAWRVLRGESCVTDIARVFDEKPCCLDDGFAGKIRGVLEPLSGVRRAVAMTTLCECLEAARAVYTGKGGCHNLVAESGFSDLRVLGLKLPYRPVKLCTGDRELAIKHYRNCHRSWFQRYVVAYYGSLKHMHVARFSKQSRLNGFSAFCKALMVPFETGRLMWQDVGDPSRQAWAVIARQLNESDTAKAKLAESFPDFPEVGPYGSVHRWMPFSAKSIFDRLNGDTPELRDAWSKRGVCALKESIEPDMEKQRVSSGPAEDIAGVKLPGDRCRDCAEERDRQMDSCKPIFPAIVSAFADFDGDSRGLLLALLIGSTVSFYDVLVLIRKPRRILCTTLRFSDFHDEVVEGLGQVPRSIVLTMPNLFNGESPCLLDLCRRVGMPRRAWVVPKRCVLSTHDGWELILESRAQELLLGDVMQARPPPRRYARAPTDASTSAFGVREFAAVFGDRVAESPRAKRRGRPADADSDATPDLQWSDESDDAGKLGRGSHSPNAAFAHDEEIVAGVVADHRVLSKADQSVIASMMSAAIDCRRYAVAVRPREGVVVVFWKDTESNRHWAAHVEAYRRIKLVPGARMLTASKSSTLSKYTLAGCVERSRLWQQWHSCWVYGEAIDLAMPPCLPLPQAIDVVSSGTGSDGPLASDAEDLCADSPSSSSVSDTSLGSDLSQPAVNRSGLRD